PDLVLHGGKIVTLDGKTPEAQAIAIRGDRILAVGSDAEIRALTAPQTKTLDLAGRMAMPGFIEGHGHFLGLGDSKRKLDVSQAKSWEEVVALVELEAKKATSGQWIVGRGWHQGKWLRPPTQNVQGYPVHEALSRVTPEH